MVIFVEQYSYMIYIYMYTKLHDKHMIYVTHVIRFMSNAGYMHDIHTQNDKLSTHDICHCVIS